MTKPLSVILVTCGSRGDRLLFRYPYEFVSWSFEKGQSMMIVMIVILLEFINNINN